MRTTIVAFSVAVLIAPAPAVFAQGVPGTAPALQKVSKKHHPAVSSRAHRRETGATSTKTGYPRAFGYAPNEVLDRETEITRKAGGGSM